MNKLLLVPLLSLLLIVTSCSGDRVIKEQKLELDSVAITFDGNEFPGASVVSARLVKTYRAEISEDIIPNESHIWKQLYITFRNDTDIWMGCGDAYTLEREVDGQWQTVTQDVIDEYGFLLTQDSLFPHSETESLFTLDVFIYEDDVPKGRYRLCTENAFTDENITPVPNSGYGITFYDVEIIFTLEEDF